MNQGYIESRQSWIEQRQFVDLAIEALVVGGHPLAAIIEERLAALLPTIPNVTGFSAVGLQSTVGLNGVNIQFDASGAIIELVDTVTGTSWASPLNPIAKFTYQASCCGTYLF